MTLKLARAWALALGWAWLIWTVSSLPLHGPVFETAAKKHLDWVAHAVEYGILALLLASALVETLGADRFRRAFVLAAFAASLFAVSDEIHQASVPYRSCSVADAWADMAGVVIALGLLSKGYLKNHA